MRQTLIYVYVNRPEEEVLANLTLRELSQHCKKRTRGAANTTRLISTLVEHLSGPAGRDVLGVPLFNGRMRDVWEEQQRHVACLQDPEGVALYTSTGSIKRGGIDLPVYRCARGSTSLESFHLHLNTFIPGTGFFCKLLALPLISNPFHRVICQ